jgi:TRAP-type C4-dicarboxylate transport system permease small subunit
MQRLLQWLEYPIHVLLWLGMLAAIFMMFHVTADVTGRTLFNSPLEGTTEMVSAYYMVAVAYLPWAWIARNDAHIRVETFTVFLPASILVWLDIVVKIVTAICVSFFVWRAILRAIQTMGSGEVWQAGTKYLIIWPSRWVLPIAGGMMVLYLVLRIAADIAAARR